MQCVVSPGRDVTSKPPVLVLDWLQPSERQPLLSSVALDCFLLQRARHENLRKDVEAKKQAMEKEMEDAMVEALKVTLLFNSAAFWRIFEAEMQRQEAEIQRIESESEQVRNKNNEIENAIQLLKHQLSTKADELAVAKVSYHVFILVANGYRIVYYSK